MENRPNRLTELVERFGRNYTEYKQATYKEAQVRKEFIDALFEELGWDVDNRSGHAEAYKEVIHEDALKIGAGTEAPDYCFRIGGVRKFFVEAKKPHVDIETDQESSYQLRRYAWSSKLPLSILTNFEHTAVYDCRFKPSSNAAPSATTPSAKMRGIPPNTSTPNLKRQRQKNRKKTQRPNKRLRRKQPPHPMPDRLQPLQLRPNRQFCARSLLRAAHRNPCATWHFCSPPWTSWKKCSDGSDQRRASTNALVLRCAQDDNFEKEF